MGHHLTICLWEWNMTRCPEILMLNASAAPAGAQLDGPMLKLAAAG